MRYYDITTRIIFGTVLTPEEVFLAQEYYPDALDIVCDAYGFTNDSYELNETIIGIEKGCLEEGSIVELDSFCSNVPSDTEVNLLKTALRDIGVTRDRFQWLLVNQIS